MAKRPIFRSLTTLEYSPNGRRNFSLNTADLFGMLYMRFSGTITNGGTSPSAAASEQVARAINQFQMKRSGGKEYIDLPGHMLSLICRRYNGTEGENVDPATTASTAVPFEIFLPLPFMLLDGVNPEDTLLDTRGGTVEGSILWNNIASAGVMWGTPNSLSVTGTPQLEIGVLEYQLLPSLNGSANELTSTRPLVRALRHIRKEVTGSNSNFEIEIPNDPTYRNFWLYTSSVASGVEVGNNSILTTAADVQLYSSGEKKNLYKLPVTFVRNITKLTMGQARPAGFYQVPVITNGKNNQAKPTNVNDRLKLILPVQKDSSNTTYVDVVMESIEEQ